MKSELFVTRHGRAHAAVITFPADKDTFFTNKHVS